VVERQYQKRQPKWDWRAWLTTEELDQLARADAAKAEWQRLNADRAKIINRAIHRAKYHEFETGCRRCGAQDNEDCKKDIDLGYCPGAEDAKAAADRIANG
jgi:hypothetical protein